MQLKNNEELVSSNLRLVSSLSSRFIGRGIEYDDLFSAGCVGLVKAAKGFDGTRGVMFSTYAVPVILGEIKRLFRDGGDVKISRSIKELYIKAVKIKDKLENELSREVTVKEIADEMKLTTEEITEAFCACRATVSLTVSDDDGEKELDVADNIDEKLTEKINIKMAIDKLDEREQKIIKFRYFGALTQSETAKKLSMSQVQVSRAEKKALKKLKNILEPGA